MILLRLFLIRTILALVRLSTRQLRKQFMATNAEVLASLSALEAAQAAESALADTLKGAIGATPAELDAIKARLDAVTAAAQATVTRDTPA
jgi:hypothetical protein